VPIFSQSHSREDLTMAEDRTLFHGIAAGKPLGFMSSTRIPRRAPIHTAGPFLV
jgi:hypothetical protein